MKLRLCLAALLTSLVTNPFLGALSATADPSVKSGEFPATADPPIACQGFPDMDGTVVINKTFCGKSREGLTRKTCEKWLVRARQDLGEQFLRSSGCSGEQPNDAGCTFIVTAQVICRLNPNRNLNPEACVNEVDHAIRSGDDLRNCLTGWAFKARGTKMHDDLKKKDFSALTSFSPKLREVYACLTIGPSFEAMDACVFDTAMKYRDPRLCVAIRNQEDQLPGPVAPHLLRTSSPVCRRNAR